MSKGFNMLREYIENDALCTRRGKCLDFEYELQREFDVLEAENVELRELIYEILVDEERGHNDDRTFSEHVIRAHWYGIAKDIEVDE